MKRVTMLTDPELTADRPVAGSVERATVEVLLTDGGRRRAVAVVPRGHPDAPLSPRDLEAKFYECSAGVLTPGQAMRALELLGRFGDLTLVSDLTSTLSARRPTPT